jgi:allantoinase
LNAKRQAARGLCHVDVGFWGGIVPGNERHIEPLIEAGVRGFKCFMTPSGVEEFESVSETDLARALPVLSRASGQTRPLLVHAEQPSRLTPPAGDPRLYSTFLATRPVEAEVEAIRLIAALTDEYHVATHIVHLSSADGVAAVRDAQVRGTILSAETCPHYLTFSADEVPDGGTQFKCAPPIRGPVHREQLWDGLRGGVCRLAATDHSPAPPALKSVDSGNFVTAWGGIASLELSLAAMWTGASNRGFTVNDIARWMSREPARLCGLDDRKGAIRVGCDADLVLWDPEASTVVNGARLQQRHKLTPYEGRTLRGVVRATYVRGMKVWDGGGLAVPGHGTLL